MCLELEPWKIGRAGLAYSFVLLQSVCKDYSFLFTHHMCVGVPTRWEAYPLFSVLIIHVCIHEGKSMNSPFFILSTNVCVSQNLLGSETLVSMCVLFVLPVICLQLEKQRFFDRIKTGRTISLRTWSLICLGSCVE